MTPLPSLVVTEDDLLLIMRALDLLGQACETLTNAPMSVNTAETQQHIKRLRNEAVQTYGSYIRRKARDDGFPVYAVPADCRRRAGDPVSNQSAGEIPPGPGPEYYGNGKHGPKYG